MKHLFRYNSQVYWLVINTYKKIIFDKIAANYNAIISYNVIIAIFISNNAIITFPDHFKLNTRANMGANLSLITVATVLIHSY